MISHEDEEKTIKVLEIIEDVNKEDKLGNSYLMAANPNHNINPLLKALG